MLNEHRSSRRSRKAAADPSASVIDFSGFVFFPQMNWNAPDIRIPDPVESFPKGNCRTCETRNKEMPAVIVRKRVSGSWHPQPTGLNTLSQRNRGRQQMGTASA